MYLKNGRITFLKVKNVLLLLAGSFFFFTGAADIISLAVYYWDDWYTVVNAVSFVESIVMMVLSLAAFIYIALSRSAIRRAGFYSGCFEGALYNDITFDDLSEVTGYSKGFVRLDLIFLRPIYMKNFDICKDNKGEYIELYSKTIQCTCKNCGADLDKQLYFTGFCPYCKTADVFATVLTDNKVYSIKSDFEAKHTDKSHYVCKNYALRFGFYITAFTIALCIFLILGAFVMDSISKYNDPQYLQDLLLSGRSYSSYELIKKDMVSTMIWSGFFAAVFLPVIILTFNRVRLLMIARQYSMKLAGARSPYLSIGSLGGNAGNDIGTVRRIRSTLQARYLRNCSIEKHDGELRVAVARRIVKDECPTCGAPIIGAVDENYVCQYCRNRIIRVIVKN